jgi:WD40 repeat protein
MLTLFLAILLQGMMIAVATAVDVCHPTRSVADPSSNLPEVEFVRELRLEGVHPVLAWSPDSKILATSEAVDNRTRIVKLWDTSDYHVLHQIQKQDTSSENLTFMPDGKRLLISGQTVDGGVNQAVFSVVDVASGRVIKNVHGPLLPGDIQPSRRIVVSLDGKRVYISGAYQKDDSIYVYDTATWNMIDSIKPPTLIDTFLAGPGKNQLTMIIGDSYNQGQTVIWDTIQNRPIQVIPMLTQAHSQNNASALTADACRLAIGVSDYTSVCVSNCSPRAGERPVLRSSLEHPVQVWDINSGRLLTDLETSGKIANSLDISPNGHWLAAMTASQDRQANVSLYGISDLHAQKALYSFSLKGAMLKFSPDGEYLAAAGSNMSWLHKMWSRITSPFIYMANLGQDGSQTEIVIFKIKENK